MDEDALVNLTPLTDHYGCSRVYWIAGPRQRYAGRATPCRARSRFIRVEGKLKKKLMTSRPHMLAIKWDMRAFGWGCPIGPIVLVIPMLGPRGEKRIGPWWGGGPRGRWGGVRLDRALDRVSSFPFFFFSISWFLYYFIIIIIFKF
jgi:hypothetical protein